MASCLVLGGAGFVGSHLTEALSAAGHRVTVFDRPREFLDPADLARALPGHEVVFHLISSTLPKTSNDDPMQDIEANVVGTLRLLQLLRTHKVRKLVFVSSGGTVYGVPRAVPIAESHPTEPNCSYGIHKLVIEKYLQLEHLLHGLDYCILRIANLYGERQQVDRAQGAIAVFLDRTLRGQPIEIWGDGSVVRDYLYVGDAVQALIKAMDHGGKDRLFNLGTGSGVSLKDLVREIEALAGRKLDVRYTPGRAFDVPSNVLDASLAARVLGWKAATPFAQGLRRTWDWMRAR